MRISDWSSDVCSSDLFARPLSSAKYLKMTTFQDSEVADGQNAAWYPWPYIEGLTMAEARHELSFIATGLYGKPIVKQNGAPLRLATPWKYGFKPVKAIVSFAFTDQRPKGCWGGYGRAACREKGCRYVWVSEGA